MTYDVDLISTANSDLDKLDPKTRKRVVVRLSWLGVNIEKIRQKALKPPYEDMELWLKVVRGAERGSSSGYRVRV